MLTFTLNSPPFSINSAYYLKSFSKKSATKIRTKECREWGDSILLQLQQHSKEFVEFKNNFDPLIHCIGIDIEFYIPNAKFYTKEQKVSMRSNDLTNVEKLLVDLIFDARFHGRILEGRKIINLDINDTLIVTLASKKRPIDSDYQIKLKILRLDNKTFEEA